VIKEVETLGNMSKSPCGGACTMVRERISKYIEGMKEIILQKIP
jgi:predicted DNA-binding protein